MTTRSLTSRLADLRLQRRLLTVLSPAQISNGLRAVAGKIGNRLSRSRRKAGLYLVRGIEKFYGSDRAHWVYWRLWPSVRGWSNTESRLRLLAEENPGAIATFVRIALMRNADPVVLMGLARHPHSRAELAAFLRGLTLTEDSPVHKMLRQRQQYAATFISVVQLLLDDAAAEPLVAQVLHLHRKVPDAFVQIVYSAGMRTALPPAGLYQQGILDSGFRGTVNHRLVIVDDYKDASAVALLFVGARQVTVLALTDLLGRADFSHYIGLGGVESIVVEHLRTRVSRFSEAYVENHEIARETAEAIATALMARPGLLNADQHSYLAVAISDFLHFQCLKVAAVSALLADPGFDHIAIGTARHVPTSEYFRLLSGVPGLANDPRVELVSIARETAPKTQFGACLATLTGRTRLAEFRTTLPADMDHLHEQIRDHATHTAARLSNGVVNSDDAAPDSGDGSVARRIFVLTANNPAYNESTARYVKALLQDHAVAIIHAGARVTPLNDELRKLGDMPGRLHIRPVPSQFMDRWDSTRRALVDLVWRLQAGLPDTAATHILKINAERLVAEVISPQLVLLQAMEAWFARLQRDDMLPSMVVLAPARVPQIAAMTVVARKYGVPSLTLEAHGLNANYSRYLKVTSDFYGVVSDQFRQEAVAGFAMPADRIAVIGTPRLVAPADHDPQAARVAARALLADEQDIAFGRRKGTISFFCQPSAFAHVTLVWQSVLRAADALDLDILLKPHPEETPTRRAAYLRIAEAIGMAARVQVVSGSPAPVIEASDAVLTGYSAAAIDAAILQVPVICVTEGAVDYPVDQHRIIDAPLVRSTQELQAHLADILSDPAAARMRAQQFLQRERQFLEGPDQRLRSYVADILAQPAETRLRPRDSVPTSVFLDGPHPIFPV